uniref:Sushi domain-containing protein n=1 Tax=Macrostomum lignano TaxID=282301 RepID=A0A1I8H3R6_9PLAT
SGQSSYRYRFYNICIKLPSFSITSHLRIFCRALQQQSLGAAGGIRTRRLPHQLLHGSRPSANVTCLSNAFAPLAANVSLQSDSQFLLQAVCTAGDWTVLNQLLLPTSETLCQPKPCLLPTNLTRSTAVPSNNLGNVTTGDGQVYLPVNSTVEVRCWSNSRFVDAYASSRTATCELGPHLSAGGSMNCQPIVCPDSHFGPGIDPSILVGPLNASVLAESATGPFLIGDQVVFACQENVSSSGSVLLNCAAAPNFTAVWQPSLSPPYC